MDANPKAELKTWAVSPSVKIATIHINHRHLLLVLCPKADSHFTIPQFAKAEST